MAQLLSRFGQVIARCGARLSTCWLIAMWLSVQKMEKYCQGLVSFREHKSESAVVLLQGLQRKKSLNPLHYRSTHFYCVNPSLEQETFLQFLGLLSCKTTCNSEKQLIYIF